MTEPSRVGNWHLSKLDSCPPPGTGGPIFLDDYISKRGGGGAPRNSRKTVLDPKTVRI